MLQMNAYRANLTFLRKKKRMFLPKSACLDRHVDERIDSVWDENIIIALLCQLPGFADSPREKI